MIVEIDNLEFIFLLCQRLVQPIGVLYTTAISWSVLQEIAFVEPRMLMKVDEETGKEEYVGIQRTLSKQRQEEIKEYVNKNQLATFPSSIIINIPIEELDVIAVAPELEVFAKADTDYNNPALSNFSGKLSVSPRDLYYLIFPFKRGMAQIIDGQHRMSGFDSAPSDLVFDLPVTIFIDQLVENQAEIFATINGKQTRVTPSLVFDLFGLSSKRSPYKVAHEMAKLLNESEVSPLKGWIRILGKSNSFYDGYITQSTFVKNFLRLICGNIKQAEEDKRLLYDEQRLSILTSNGKSPVLRSYFVNKEDDVIFKILTNFFKSVKTVFASEWAKKDSVLKKTVGFTALFKLMEYYIAEGRKVNNLTELYFTRELEKYASVTFENIQLSSKGVNQILTYFDK